MNSPLLILSNMAAGIAGTALRCCNCCCSNVWHTTKRQWLWLLLIRIEPVDFCCCCCCCWRWWRIKSCCCCWSKRAKIGPIAWDTTADDTMVATFEYVSDEPTPASTTVVTTGTDGWSVVLLNACRIKRMHIVTVKLMRYPRRQQIPLLMTLGCLDQTAAESRGRCPHPLPEVGYNVQTLWRRLMQLNKW